MSSQIDFKQVGEEESMLPDQEARVREEEKDALLENTLHHLQKGYNCDLSQRFVFCFLVQSLRLKLIRPTFLCII